MVYGYLSLGKGDISPDLKLFPVIFDSGREKIISPQCPWTAKVDLRPLDASIIL